MDGPHLGHLQEPGTEGPGCCCIHPWAVVDTPTSSCRTRGPQTPLQRWPQGHGVTPSSHFSSSTLLGCPSAGSSPVLRWHGLAGIASPWRDAQPKKLFFAQEPVISTNPPAWPFPAWDISRASPPACCRLPAQALPPHPEQDSVLQPQTAVSPWLKSSLGSRRGVGRVFVSWEGLRAALLGTPAPPAAVPKGREQCSSSRLLGGWLRCGCGTYFVPEAVSIVPFFPLGKKNRLS